MIKKYDQYKDSGVEWIGKIPSTWKTIKIKWTTPVKRGASPRPIADPKYFDDDGEYAWVRIADVTASERYLCSTKDQLSELGASLSVKQYPGDLFLSIAGSVGKPIITKIKCCIHDGFVWFPELKMNPEYLFYLFQSGLPFIGLGKVGTQLNLNTETIGNIQIPVSSKQEVDRIVEYLDHQTGLIDAIIEKKRQLIKKLKEQRQAIINGAVTKGLNSEATLKDSGVDWIGDIPNNWKVSQYKFEAQVQNGFAFNSNLFDKNEGFPLLRIRDITTGNISTYYKGEYDKEYIIEKGDLLIGMDGDYNVRWWKNSKALLNQRCCRIIENENVLRRFLYYTLPFNLKIINDLTYFTTVKHLSSSDILNAKLPMPPIHEQNEIIQYLDIQTNLIDQIIRKNNHSIQKLREQRQAVIKEAITGNIDVREWEPKIKEIA